jgi:hypothetical protein
MNEWPLVFALCLLFGSWWSFILHTPLLVWHIVQWRDGLLAFDAMDLRR